MRKIPGLMLVLLCICLLSLSAEAASMYSMAEVTRSAVNIRRTPGGKVMDKLQKGECVNIIDKTVSGGKEWDRIIVSRKTDNVVICGYVDDSFLEDITDKYTGVAEAAPGDRHVVLRFSNGRTVAVGETFMGNLSISGWPPVRQVAVMRFMSAGVGLDDVLYTSGGYSKPDHILHFTNVDTIFPCAEDIDLIAIRDRNGRFYCGLESFEWLFPDRYTGASQVDFTPYFSAALKDGQVMVTVRDVQLLNAFKDAEMLYGITRIACGAFSLACLDATGHVHVFTEEPTLKAAEEWTNVTDIVSASGFIVGLFSDGTVKMCGGMTVRNRNYAIASDEPTINYNDILSNWRSVAEIRANNRMLLARTGDGHLYVLYPNRYE